MIEVYDERIGCNFVELSEREGLLDLILGKSTEGGKKITSRLGDLLGREVIRLSGNYLGRASDFYRSYDGTIYVQGRDITDATQAWPIEDCYFVFVKSKLEEVKEDSTEKQCKLSLENFEGPLKLQIPYNLNSDLQFQN